MEFLMASRNYSIGSERLPEVELRVSSSLNYRYAVLLLLMLLLLLLRLHYIIGQSLSVHMIFRSRKGSDF